MHQEAVAKTLVRLYDHEIQRAFREWNHEMKQIDKDMYGTLQNMVSNLQASDTTGRLRSLLKAGQHCDQNIRSRWTRNCMNQKVNRKLYQRLMLLLTGFLHHNWLIRANAVIPCATETLVTNHHATQNQHLPHNEPVALGPAPPPGAFKVKSITIIRHEPVSETPLTEPTQSFDNTSLTSTGCSTPPSLQS